jgi:hypothetical protein
VRGHAIIISTLTLALSRQREREVMIFSSFVGDVAAMGITMKKAYNIRRSLFTRSAYETCDKKSCN